MVTPNKPQRINKGKSFLSIRSGLITAPISQNKRVAPSARKTINTVGERYAGITPLAKT